MAFSKDGKEVATVFIKDDGTHVYAWKTRDLKGGNLMFQRQSRAFPEQFYQMAFSYDGSYLAGTAITSGLYYWPTAKADNASRSEQERYAASADASSDENQEYSVIDLSARGMALAFASPPYHVLASWTGGFAHDVFSSLEKFASMDSANVFGSRPVIEAGQDRRLSSHFGFHAGIGRPRSYGKQSQRDPIEDRDVSKKEADDVVVRSAGGKRDGSSFDR